jgi:hypothetical protein
VASQLRAVVVLTTLATSFAVSWHLGLWLVFLTMAATGIALAAGEQLGERVLAQRAAALALYMPVGESEASAIEPVVAADLAASAVSDTELLDHTITRAEHTIVDPWLRALATERLQLARDLVATGNLPSPPRVLHVLASRPARLMAVVATFGLTLAAAGTRNHLLLVALAVSVAAVGIGQGESRRRQRLPLVLCEEAATPLPRGLVFIREFSVVGALSSITSSRQRVLARAISLVSARRGPRCEVAVQRLLRATRRAPDQPPPTLTHDVLAWAVAAAAATVVIEVL